MPEPQGRLVTPVGLNSEGYPRAGNLPFTYKTVLKIYKQHIATGAGWESWDTIAVPEDEIWIVTSIVVMDETNAVTGLILAVYNGATYYHLKSVGATGANISLDWQGWVPLVEGEYLQGWKNGGVVGDSLILGVRGFVMT